MLDNFGNFEDLFKTEEEVKEPLDIGIGEKAETEEDETRWTQTAIEIFQKAVVEKKTSDIVITPGIPPKYYRANEWYDLEGFKAFTPEEVKKILFAFLSKEQQARFEEELELDFAIEVQGVGRFRGNIFYKNSGREVAGVFRYIPEEIPPVDKLGLPEIVKNFVKYDKGLVLVTGPTGSGKTTTLASLINLILTTYRKHVITIEDPIEFVFKHGKGIVNQRQLEVDTKSFYRALKSALREKPDVILVGELRDPETMEVALTAAETGHLVFSTLHTNSAIETINRIASVFPSTKQDQIRTQLSFVLKGVISQKLLKRRDRQGRVLAAEVMVPNNAIRSLIRDNKIEQIRNYINSGSDTGILMEESLARLVRIGMVEYEEALMVANDKEYFENLYRRIRV